MRSIKKLLCLYDMPEEYRNKLMGKLPETEIQYGNAFCSEEDIKSADVIFGNPRNRDALISSSSLKWLHLASAGADGYFDRLPQDIYLSNSTGAYGEAVGEHLLAMTLSLMKCFPYYDEGKSQHKWMRRRKVKGLRGLKVLIFGLGDIGSYYAKLMKSLGAYVIGVRGHKAEKPDYIDELYFGENNDELIKMADVIAMAMPRTPETVNFMNKERIDMMKEDAILLNVGRGGAVDEKALAEALYENRIFGAGLDVFDKEPLPEENKLWDCPNLLITSHSAGFITLEDTKYHVIDIFMKTLDEYLEDKPLSTLVDRKTGYRMR